ncbi:MAG: hypothetical protein JNK37_15765 [Verrucomicrobiales bacterium]|nr:hypothetical protein [Verrucomicrobiales bacterium]
MASKRKDAGMQINLFPFLSVVVCIIGCLTLIIVVMNIMSMSKAKEGREPEEVERAKEFQVLKKQEEEDQKKYDDLRKLVDSLTRLNQDLLAKRQKLTMLQDMSESAEKIDASREELIAKFQTLSKANTQLAADEKLILSQIETLKKEIEQRKLPPDAAALVVRPSGSGANTEPYFVEVADGQLLIHYSLKEPAVPVPAGSMEVNPNLRKLLDTIAQRPYRTLIVLVRGSDGAVANLGKLSGVVGVYNEQFGSQINPGRLPLPGEGKVDLSLFAQYLEKSQFTPVPADPNAPPTPAPGAAPASGSTPPAAPAPAAPAPGQK